VAGFRLLIGVSVLVSLGTGYSVFIHSERQQTKQIVTYPLVSPPRHSLQAFIDPDTGRLARPSRQQLEQLKQSHAQSGSNTQRVTRARQVQHGNGMVVLELEQHYRPETPPTKPEKINPTEVR